MEEQEAGDRTSVLKERRAIEHRSNKHAYVASRDVHMPILISHSPMEVTSKKPVPRRRQVVEVHRVVRVAMVIHSLW